MFALKVLLLATAVFAVNCQHNGPTTTPVPILKQINKQNDDGSYSYGYEAADGSFKIETKYPSGDVAGKYGYIDENGKPREISYGASSQRGFEPEGAGIQVPPPTLHDPSNALTDGQEDDGQYREDPKIYEDPKYNGRAQQRQPAQAVRQYHRPAQPAQPEPEPEYQQYQSSFPARQPQPQRAQYQTQTSFQDYQPQSNFQYQSQPQQNFQQRQPQTSQFRSGPLFTQQTSLFSQGPQQFPQENRPQSQVYHQQPQFSYQAFTPQPYTQPQAQTYQPQAQAYQPPAQTYQPQAQAYQPQAQTYQPQPQPQNYQGQSYNQFGGHPAQNFDPSTGSYTINFTG